VREREGRGREEAILSIGAGAYEFFSNNILTEILMSFEVSCAKGFQT
jgi:hypothetical protein